MVVLLLGNRITCHGNSENSDAGPPSSRQFDGRSVRLSLNELNILFIWMVKLP